MKGPRVRTVLIVTPLDYRKQPNNVEHSRVEHYTKRGMTVSVLYKTMNQSSRPIDMFLDTVTCRVRREQEGPVRLISVDPFFNYFAGLRRSAEEGSCQPSRRPSLRLLAVRLLSPLSVLRDAFFVPCFLLAALVERRAGYDLCLGIGAWGGFIGWLLRRLGRVGVLVYEDRDYEPGLVPDRLRQAYTAALERFGIRRADSVVSVGRLLARLRLEQTGREVAVIPNGVDWEKFSTARGAPKTGGRLVYVGNVIAWSGIELALAAVARLAPGRPELTLRIIGYGLPSYFERLRELVRALGIEDRVEFAGPRPPEELPELLAEADIGLANSEPVPFRIYACPLKIVEYMAAGLTVVVTEGTEAAEIVTLAQAGISVPYDADALTHELARLLDDPSRCEDMRMRGIEYARQLDWNDLLDRELELVANA